MQSGLAEESRGNTVPGAFTETCSLAFLDTHGRHASARHDK
jgi:peroxiredoxin